MKKCFLTVLSILFIASCQHQIIDIAKPGADFDVQAETINAVNPLYTFLSYEPIKFVNKNTNSTAYSWNFGNNTASQDKDPVITYYEGNQYTVELISKNQQGIEQSKTTFIRVADRVLKELLIENIKPTNDEAELQIEIRTRDVTQMPNVIGGRLLYQSEFIKTKSLNAGTLSLPIIQRVDIAPLKARNGLLNLREVYIFQRKGEGRQLLFATDQPTTMMSEKQDTDTYQLTVVNGGLKLWLNCIYR